MQVPNTPSTLNVQSAARSLRPERHVDPSVDENPRRPGPLVFSGMVGKGDVPSKTIRPLTVAPAPSEIARPVTSPDTLSRTDPYCSLPGCGCPLPLNDIARPSISYSPGASLSWNVPSGRTPVPFMPKPPGTSLMIGRTLMDPLRVIGWREAST